MAANELDEVAFGLVTEDQLTKVYRNMRQQFGEDEDNWDEDEFVDQLVAAANETFSAGTVLNTRARAVLDDLITRADWSQHPAIVGGQ